MVRFSFRLGSALEIAERTVNDAAVSDSAVVAAVAESGRRRPGHFRGGRSDTRGLRSRRRRGRAATRQGVVVGKERKLASAPPRRLGAFVSIAGGSSPDSVMANLGAMLEEKNRQLVIAVRRNSPREFGTKSTAFPACWPAAPRLIDRDVFMVALAGTSLAIPARSATAACGEFFAHDAELRRLALQTMAAHRKETIHRQL